MQFMKQTENQLAKTIINTCFNIHVDLGPGLFESVYEEVLCYELKEKGLSISRQQGIPLNWKNNNMGIGFKADIIVENKVLIELKSVDAIGLVHRKQVLTYLKLSGLKLGLLINFNEDLIKNGIYRIVNNL